jgi:hypothetical protein
MGSVFSVLAVALLALGAWFWSSYKTRPGIAAEERRQVKSSLHLRLLF